MTCRWNRETECRVVLDRHERGCESETCPGCQPCTTAHCRICTVSHAETEYGTCPECLAETREALRDIGRMCDALPEEVEHRGIHGEAMMLLGPVADPEARGHLAASVACGRVSADYLETADGDQHPLFVLGTWEMVYRDALDHETDKKLTVEAAIDYLDQNLAYLAGYEHVPFEDLARDLRRCRTHLEAVLHDGEQVEKGAPCLGCGKPLTHAWGQRVIDDRWVCTTRRCDVSGYTDAQYRGWVEEDARSHADRLTAQDMALRFPEVKATQVRVWGSRELVRKRGRDANGMTLYDVADVRKRLEQPAGV